MANRKANEVKNEFKFTARTLAAMRLLGVGLSKEVCASADIKQVREELADLTAKHKLVSASLKRMWDQLIDVAQADGVKFGVVYVNGVAKPDERCVVRTAFWDSVYDAGMGVAASSGYVKKIKSQVNTVMAGLAESIGDLNDKAAKRNAYAQRSEPADAKPATTVAAPNEPNPYVDSVASTWHYISTAPTHLAMLRRVVARLEETEGLTLEKAVEAAVKEYDAAQRAMMKGSK